MQKKTMIVVPYEGMVVAPWSNWAIASAKIEKDGDVILDQQTLTGLSKLHRAWLSLRLPIVQISEKLNLSNRWVRDAGVITYEGLGRLPKVSLLQDKDVSAMEELSTEYQFVGLVEPHLTNIQGYPIAHDSEMQWEKVWTAKNMASCKIPGSTWYVDKDIVRLNRARKQHFRTVMIKKDLMARMDAQAMGHMTFPSWTEFANTLLSRKVGNQR